MTALSPKQYAGLARAVTRRSCGTVSLPRVELSRAEAIQLWQDLGLATAAPQGLLLTSREQALLAKRAWARSAGHVALGEAALSRQSGLALWRLAIRLGDVTARRSPNPVSRAASIAAIGLVATQLAACTSLFGGNIKGSFACSAPGGTCAPSTVIDDQALSVIQNARPMTPAGPYIRQPAAAKPVTAAYTPSGSGRLTSAGGGLVHRERRVLKVVFPSFVDGGGNLHEPRIIHAVVDDGAWMELSSGEPNIGEQVEGRAVSLASAAFVPSSAAAAPIVQDAVSPTPNALDAAPSAPPRPEAVAAARAKGAALQSGNPIEAIQAQVQARLAGTAKAQAAPAPAPKTLSAAAPAPAPTAAASPTPMGAKPANGPAAFPAKVEE